MSERALKLTVKQDYSNGWWEARDATALLRCYGKTPEDVLTDLVVTWRAMWPQEPDNLPCPGERPADARKLDAEQLARRFHEAYERLAPGFGYTTRPETRDFDPQSANGRLMVAVCAELLSAAASSPAPEQQGSGIDGVEGQQR